jgi:hypothetical protein
MASEVNDYARSRVSPRLALPRRPRYHAAAWSVERRQRRQGVRTAYSGTEVGDRLRIPMRWRRSNHETARCTALFDKPVRSAIIW